VSFQQVVHPALAGEAEGVEAAAILEEDRMNMHKNARLTPRGRERIVELVGHLQADKIELWDISIHRPSLEDLFIELTGREIRQ